MARIQKLTPGGGSHPVFGHISRGLHEAFGRSSEPAL